jgi:hypothetical protein
MDNKYAPLTEQQFYELKGFIQSLGGYMPENMAGYVWSTYNAVRGENEVQPCTCASSGKHWKRAIDHLWNWVNERS